MTSFTYDIDILKHYPAVEYDATESGGVYHEDREITYVVGVAPRSSLYRVSNASFDGVKWNLKTSGTAYATAQNPDGSTSYLKSPTTTPWLPNAWAGSGNFTRFNAADYGMSPAANASQNALALSTALLDAAAAGGGRVFIPAATYTCDTVDIPDSGPGGPIGLVIEGAGDSTVLHSPGGEHMFSATGDNGYSGVRIRDISFTYPSDAVLGAWCAIYSTVQAVICEGCRFQNWPTAFHMEGTHNGMLNCSIFYNGLSATETVSPTMINMEKSDNFVANCYIYQDSIDKDGPTGVIAIRVGSASEPRVTDTNIVHVDYGIMITGGPNLIHGFFSAISAECATTALTINPLNNSDWS